MAEEARMTTDGFARRDIPSLTEQQRLDAEGRAEVASALGSLKGYAGHLSTLNDPCPRCAAEGCMTSGSYTPRLRRAPGGMAFCLTHGDAHLV